MAVAVRLLSHASAETNDNTSTYKDVSHTNPSFTFIRQSPTSELLPFTDVSTKPSNMDTNRAWNPPFGNEPQKNKSRGSSYRQYGLGSQGTTTVAAHNNR